jgi:hypothetical protein
VRAVTLLVLVIVACNHGPGRDVSPGIPRRPLDFANDVGLVFVRGGSYPTILYHRQSQRIPVGTQVTIILPTKATTLTGQVTQKPPPAEEYVQRPFGPDIGTKRAVLKVKVGDLTPALGVAVIGHSVAVKREAGVFVAELDGEPPRESFRACASTEGAHLTVWSGQPLRGKRRWHTYYYLGYDTESDCTPGDFR